MTTVALVHVTVSGLATGSIYALMALALVIVYNATRTLNFAQGELLMISAFLGWTGYRTLGLSLGLRAAAGILWTHDEFPFFFGDRPVAWGPVRLAPVSLGIIGASLALMAAL